jgi:geranylgeranyl diphosphate synthase type II
MISFEEALEIIRREIEKIEYPDRPDGLYEPVRYMLAMKGKKLRPALTLLACNLYTDDVSPAIDAALAWETFHNFTLMHDDLMDRADIRRGQATVHRRWNDNTAILSGDAMLILAYRLIARSVHTEVMLEVFSRTAAEICEGQQYDMEFESRTDISLAEYIEMIRLKTAVLLGACLRSGAIAGNAPETDADLLCEFGVHLGLAFQIRDDLLDAYGDPALFGKKIGGDILCNKKTFLLVNALNRATPTDLQTALQWLCRNDDPDGKIKFFLDLYDRLEIRQQAESAIADNYKNAIAALDKIGVGEAKKTMLRKVAANLMSRKS